MGDPARRHGFPAEMYGLRAADHGAEEARGEEFAHAEREKTGSRREIKKVLAILAYLWYNLNS